MIEVQKKTADKAFFIKLGSEGKWEEECLQEGLIRVSYNRVPIEMCHTCQSDGRWDRISDLYRVDKKASTATRNSTELRIFCEADPQTLWITFSDGKMWWAYAKDPVFIGRTRDGEECKNRLTSEPWSHTDISGGIDLDVTKISSRLSQVVGYRGTICKVGELQYLLYKINGEVIPEVKLAQDANTRFVNSMIPLIRNLTWQDFELLVDLVFTAGGWRRIGILGKREKGIDLDMMQPVTGERAFVQVKSKVSLAEAKEVADYAESLTLYARRFLVTHTFQGPLTPLGRGNLEIVNAERLALLILNAGLSDWLLAKSS